MPAAPWCVLRSRYGYERRAVRSLTGILPAFTPMRRTEAGLTALLSGYVFAQIGDAESWHVARRAIGVWSIVHANGDEMPMPVYPRSLVDGWLAVADSDGIVAGLEPPKQVESFAHLVGKVALLREGMTGEVIRIDDRSWAIVRTTLFNRPYDIAAPAATLIVEPERANRRIDDREPRRTRTGWLRNGRRRERRRYQPGTGLVPKSEWRAMA